jgi:uncharacterized protein with HEPN domain
LNMSPSVLEYFEHILTEINYLGKYSENLTFDQFINDETLKRSFSRSIEIIGEAIKKVPGDISSEYPDIEWRALSGMRDKLIHKYFGVDYEILWDVVCNKIPQLRPKLIELIKNLNVE